MERLIGLVAAPERSAAPAMAAQALLRAARRLGGTLEIETRSALGIGSPLTAEQIGAAHAVLIAADDTAGIDEARFAGKAIHRVSIERAIREADALVARIARAAADADGAVPAASMREQATDASTRPAANTAAPARALKIVAITSCPTGIAHTFMAAEGLAQGARQLGHAIHVETQGSVGAQNRLSEAQIAEADLVVIAADTQVDKSRFAGKRLYETGTKGAIGGGAALLERAIEIGRAHV